MFPYGLLGQYEKALEFLEPILGTSLSDTINMKEQATDPIFFIKRVFARDLNLEKEYAGNGFYIGEVGKSSSCASATMCAPRELCSLNALRRDATSDFLKRLNCEAILTHTPLANCISPPETVCVTGGDCDIHGEEDDG
jgi:predicted metal-binding protein